MRSADHSCRHLPMSLVSNGALCSGVALPWNSLCCWGGCDAIWEGQGRAEQEENVFPGNLSQETLSALSEVPLSRLVSDIVSAVPHHAGIWAHQRSDSPVTHPTYVLASALHQFLKRWGVEVGRIWVRLGSSWTLSLQALGMQPCEFLPLPGCGWQRHKKQN